MPKYTESVPAQIGITTANSILAVVNVVGNCLVCLVVIKHQDMRYEALHYFVSLENEINCRKPFSPAGLLKFLS